VAIQGGLGQGLGFIVAGLVILIPTLYHRMKQRKKESIFWAVLDLSTPFNFLGIGFLLVGLIVTIRASILGGGK
jgi:hypothetical protein